MANTHRGAKRECVGSVEEIILQFFEDFVEVEMCFRVKSCVKNINWDHVALQQERLKLLLLGSTLQNVSAFKYYSWINLFSGWLYNIVCIHEKML